ncbi:EEF1A lysine methyltransferase 1 [Desmophyllum pertusum]|uniref:EEF1A lysine methyltransferase 1 n=1 Tax=Desmophyllum pertusum TaxID=174260 RepID=A0A9X0DC07_9CNID|nr:EEF1A lysine methyltransferase 1 [Desmophyllum pertusum]
MADGEKANDKNQPVESDNDSDDDIPQLSAQTLAALQGFYDEQKQREVSASEENDAIDEDWENIICIYNLCPSNSASFGNDDSTASALAEEVLRASCNGRIACLCAPTLYKKLLSIKPVGCEAKIFEYDRRFAVFGEDFIFYDYKKRTRLYQLPSQSIPLIWCLPTPLSFQKNVSEKLRRTIKYLAKEKIILVHWSVMEELAFKLLRVTPCKYQPTHERNLGNKFACFVNYDSDLNK